ncbi:AcrR family transcriptional regulator [Rhizobium sp. SG_E_25_P2]|uniref:TetR/AcrR family transcriptional regulator n=1 Tax=Rhizobium sp. SG_E_25_P2 TaxID=2879942 RepID=UPI002473A023|nr:TetR/AcrR family transcriptional regulator [Rhizobium sp. SG_E_25_P2]MDH6267413.1 AcrR family transcriptional regulator [Rhizobium sp. SG_E_25_P2]
MIDGNKGQERGRGRPRRGEGHDRAALLAVALACFAENGFKNTSLRMIAATAGVDVALISYHYGSKLGLWTDVVTSVADDSLERLTSFLRDCAGLDDRERLSRIAARIVEMISERPQFAQLMVGEMIAADDTTRSDILETRLVAPMLGVLLPALRSIHRDGEEPVLDEVLMVVASFAMAGLVVSTRPFLTRLTPVARADGGWQDAVSALLARILKA